MKNALRPLVAALVFGAIVVAGFAFFADASEILEVLRRIHPGWVAAALGLAVSNYLLRMAKWNFFLRLLGQRVPRGRSAAVFFAGLSMSMTPGKLGELLKALLLRDLEGVPVATTAPVVLGERLTDLLSLVVMITGGVWVLGYGWDVLLLATAMCGLVVLGVLYPPFTRGVLWGVARTPGVRKMAGPLGEAFGNMAALLAVGPMLWATLLSAAAWSLECVAFWLILRGLGVADAPLLQATFVYALGTVAGAVSMLPGGLVATEGSMVLLLTKVLGMTTLPVAVAATLLVRLCTLWFATFLGAAVLLGHPGTRGALVRVELGKG
ncbi:MAG: lysylphosphatidylglycerol synthase transmembrane domain-containing protein [Pseudomonadota bacterium]